MTRSRGRRSAAGAGRSCRADFHTFHEVGRRSGLRRGRGRRGGERSQPATAAGAASVSCRQPAAGCGPARRRSPACLHRGRQGRRAAGTGLSPGEGRAGVRTVGSRQRSASPVTSRAGGEELLPDRGQFTFRASLPPRRADRGGEKPSAHCARWPRRSQVVWSRSGRGLRLAGGCDRPRHGVEQGAGVDVGPVDGAQNGKHGEHGGGQSVVAAADCCGRMFRNGFVVPALTFSLSSRWATSFLAVKNSSRMVYRAFRSSPTSAERRPPRTGRPGVPVTCPCAAPATQTKPPARKPPAPRPPQQPKPQEDQEPGRGRGCFRRRP